MWTILKTLFILFYSPSATIVFYIIQFKFFFVPLNAFVFSCVFATQTAKKGRLKTTREWTNIWTLLVTEQKNPWQHGVCVSVGKQRKTHKDKTNRRKNYLNHEIILNCFPFLRSRECQETNPYWNGPIEISSSSFNQGLLSYKSWRWHLDLIGNAF